MSLLQQLDLSIRSKSTLDHETFGRLRAFIYEKTGIYFQDNKQYLLESRVGQRLRALGLDAFEDYYGLICNGGAYRELPHLVNAVTINETFFFRSGPQLDALEQEILPEIIGQRQAEGKRRVRIWSAACSTGDEPYSLAIVIRERMLRTFPHVTFDIIGTDINTEVLDVARSGVYGDYAVRNVPPAYRARYFTKEGDRHVLSPEIRRMVRFQQMNLADRTAMMRMQEVDVILCANVLIYFDPTSKQQVVSSLQNALNPGGYLLVGFSETLYGVTQALQPVRFDKSIAYKKG